MNPSDRLCQQKERDVDPGLSPVDELRTTDVGFNFPDNRVDLHRISVCSKVGTVEVKDLKKDVRKRDRHACYGDRATE